jgi:hypothetical protein
MKRIKIGKLGVLVCVLSVNLCAALPPQDGVEVRGAAGYARHSYTSGGCGGPEYRSEADDLKAHARAQVHSKQDHWAVTVEGSVSRDEVRSVEKIAEGDGGEQTPASRVVGDKRWGYMAALRGGMHWRYGGLDVGPTLFSNGITAPGNAENDLSFFVSGDAWAGDPQTVYAWASVFEGPTSASFVSLASGIGHKGEHVRGTLGYTFFEQQVVGQVEFLLPIAQPLWVGVMAHGKGVDDVGGMMTVAVPLRLD